MPEIVTPPLLLILAAAFGYLAGAIPFGMVVARLMGLGNLREIGSGNIGATNVLRTGNRAAALLTLLFDAGKGAAAALAAQAALSAQTALAVDAAQIAGLAAFLGHLFPVWLRFRGGKGVATGLGLLLALSFPAGLCVCLSWLAVAATTRLSSLSALVAMASAPLWMLWWGYPQGVLLAILLAVLVYARHLPNIRRLAQGVEPRIGKGG